MRSLSPLNVIVACSVFCVSSITGTSLFPPYNAIQHPLQAKSSEYSSASAPLNQWLEDEEKIATSKVLANVAPGGSEVPDAAPGSVIASPSKQDPDYYYQWTRDSAICVFTLLDTMDSNPESAFSPRILRFVDDYAKLQHRLQHQPNPSGTFDDLSGVGEPKFHHDAEAFNGPWGRPQHDGPALRAIALIHYIQYVNRTQPSLWFTKEGRLWFETLYNATLPANSTIKADLEYVSHCWNQPGFDLWEETQGLHFYTAMVQHRALRDGMLIAAAFDDPGAKTWYEYQADQISNMLSSRFWDHAKGHLVETLDTDRSGLDCGILLAALHTTGRSETYMSNSQTSPFKPWSQEVLSTLVAFVEDQKARHPINEGKGKSYLPIPVSGSVCPSRNGVAVGRYPEDEYNGYHAIPHGGNPWFICTNAVAEIFFRVAEHLLLTRDLSIIQSESPFWLMLAEETASETFGIQNHAQALIGSHQHLNKTIGALLDAGDAYLEVVGRHAGADGAMSEQFHRTTGYQAGARDLTWSYASFLSAVKTRKAVMSMWRDDRSIDIA